MADYFILLKKLTCTKVYYILCLFTELKDTHQRFEGHNNKAKHLN